MDSRTCNSFLLLFILALLCLQSRAGGTGSVFFLDSRTNQYFRSHSSDSAAEIGPLLLLDIGAAVSVLLGFAPPPTLSAVSSSKLNEVLMPNPFDRPRAVFMLEVIGAEDSQLTSGSGKDLFDGALKSKVIVGQSKADIQLPDENEVSVTFLNERLHFDSDTSCTDKELNDFASWLSGSYVNDALKPLNGELTIPLADGSSLSLHMSKKVDREFIVVLVSIIRNIHRAIETHQDLSTSTQNPAELIIGSFDGIKSLQEQYGTGVAHQGVKLFVTSISKMFDSMQAAYKGQIVGVIFSSGAPHSESESRLNVVFDSQSSPRLLEETKSLPNATIVAEVILVRRTLAWITGIILLIATLLGIHFLLNMPLTRDTLLYSNVKLD